MAKKLADPETPVFTTEKLLEILVRLRLKEMTDEMKQKELVEMLGDFDCTARQIGMLLDAPMSSVSPVLSRKKRAKKTA